MGSRVLGGWRFVGERLGLFLVGISCADVGAVQAFFAIGAILCSMVRIWRSGTASCVGVAKLALGCDSKVANDFSTTSLSL